MAGQKELENVIDQILLRNRSYTKDAYKFLVRALGYTQRKLNKQGHVTSGELLLGIKDLALAIYGPMAKHVFESWGVHKTADWGEIVFALVTHNYLGKTAEDKKEDFEGVYDFEDVFVREYRYKVKDK